LSSVQIGYPGSTDAGLLNHKIRNGLDWQICEASAIYRRAANDETADLDRAILLLREATGAMSHDDKSWVSGLSNLVQAMELRSKRRGARLINKRGFESANTLLM